MKPVNSDREPIQLAWSPFSLVQACRLHNAEADEKQPDMRLFKVSIFHHGVTHFFAVHGEKADAERARWVADIARTIRVLTQSLYPPFSIQTEPLEGAWWTSSRLMAGYIVLCNNQDVSLVYCELHAHKGCEAAFVAYKDEYCDSRVVYVSMGLQTCVSERVGVDCSCFSVDGHHFTTRSSLEKTLWLRAVSNVKVKLRHNADCPTEQDLEHYRAAILESARRLQISEDTITGTAKLPRRPHQRSQHRKALADVPESDKAGGSTEAPKPKDVVVSLDSISQDAAAFMYGQPAMEVDAHSTDLPTGGNLHRASPVQSTLQRMPKTGALGEAKPRSTPQVNVASPQDDFPEPDPELAHIKNLATMQDTRRSSAAACESGNLPSADVGWIGPGPRLPSTSISGPTMKPPQLLELIVEEADARLDPPLPEMFTEDSPPEEAAGQECVEATSALACAAPLVDSEPVVVAPSRWDVDFPPVASEHMPAVMKI
jgi:hypothetical protein